MNPPITVDAQLGELLEAYPALDGKLTELAPAWGALRNPVVRRAVTRGSTVAQAAEIAGISGAEMVAALRRAAGVDEETPREDWLMGATVVERIDVDAMLKTGVHPVGLVKERLPVLAPGEALELVSSFCPQPLIDLMRGSGYLVSTVEAEPGRHYTRFGRTI